MSMYFGCKMSPEINVPDVWDLFEAEGFAEFLYYFRDLSTGQERKTPGFNSLSGTKNDIFNAWRDYVAVHGMRERHERILNQVKDINGLEEMTKYDLFTAGGGCLISSENQNPPKTKILDVKKDPENELDEDSYDISQFYPYEITA